VRFKITKKWLIETFSQMVKYGLVGVINTGVTLGAFFVLLNIFHVQYVVSNTAGYILGFINSFIWNKLWTFKSGGFSTREIILFTIVFLVCFAIQSGLLIFFKETLRLDIIWAQIVSMVIYTMLGFAGNKLLTFRK
jgi:putative flippase GtrA